MTPEQLRVFVTVAEMEHMTRAAQVLNITQSTASAAIAALENRHEVKLFDRVGRGIALTQEGRAFLPEARAVLAQIAEAEAALAETRGLARGHIRMIASQTIAGYWLPPHLAAFRVRFPGITFTLDIGNSEEAGAQLRAGGYDLAFVEGHIDEAQLVRRQVGADRMRLVSAQPPPEQPVRQTSLAAQPWVLREAGSGTRSNAQAAMTGLGVPPDVVEAALVLPSNEAVMSAVEAGAGLTILSAHVIARSLATGALHDWGVTLPPRAFYALRHRDHHISRAMRAFIDHLEANPP
ncbi:LysR family transcriptional regulator [Thioclava sp. 15-R06ZXC-3]|uniref:LysR family transcriptional regulator n=1 Tax=Thioclava arctica TaxID=3238301 RepID=A0ABV3TEN8_9RHOB